MNVYKHNAQMISTNMDTEVEKKTPKLKKWELFVLQADTDSINEFS